MNTTLLKMNHKHQKSNNECCFAVENLENDFYFREVIYSKAFFIGKKIKTDNSYYLNYILWKIACHIFYFKIINKNP